MKHILFLFLTLSCSFMSSAQAVMGEADLFTYDLSGNRTLRTYNPNTTINYKMGNNNQPIDTVVEKLNNNKILVIAYPNPADDYITIENRSWTDKDIAVVQVYDITGKLISTKEVTKAKDNIQLGHVAVGTYLLNYHYNGRFLTSWKVIKH